MRSPEPNSQLKRLVYIPLNEEEKTKSANFKKLCNQDGIQIHDLLNEAIDLVFKVHHWPPGNPQLTLQHSVELRKVISLGKCESANCGLPATYLLVHLLSKKEHRFCSKHFCLVPMRFDSKIWQIKERL